MSTGTSSELERQERFSAHFFPCNAIGPMLNHSVKFCQSWRGSCPRCKNVLFPLHRRIRNLGFCLLGHGKVVFHMCRSNFPTAMSRFFGNLANAAKYLAGMRTTGAQRWPGMATRSTLREPVGERDPCRTNSARSGSMRRHRKTERCTTSQLS